MHLAILLVALRRQEQRTSLMIFEGQALEIESNQAKQFDAATFVDWVQAC